MLGSRYLLLFKNRLCLRFTWHWVFAEQQNFTMELSGKWSTTQYRQSCPVFDACHMTQWTHSPHGVRHIVYEASLLSPNTILAWRHSLEHWSFQCCQPATTLHTTPKWHVATMKWTLARLHCLCLAFWTRSTGCDGGTQFNYCRLQHCREVIVIQIAFY